MLKVSTDQDHFVSVKANVSFLRLHYRNEQLQMDQLRMQTNPRAFQEAESHFDGLMLRDKNIPADNRIRSRHQVMDR